MYFRYTFVTIVFGYLPCISAGLTCLFCTNVPVPRDCRTVKRCGSHEVCYIDQVFSVSGHITYNLGCRDTQFCTTNGRRSPEEEGFQMKNTTNDVMIRSVGDLKMCGSCCNGDLCNSAGCAVSGYPERNARGPVCYACAQQHAPDSCDIITECGQNSICKVKLDAHTATGDMYYSSSCEDPQVCHQDAVFHETIVGRKRSTEEVDTANHQCVVKCCDGDLCNGQCGSTGTISSSEPCHINPCVHGQCQAVGSSYQCHCYSGYTGINCDIVPDPCHSSPCVNGRCQSLGSSYQCHCYSGYTGTNCNIAHSDPCHNNPCAYGQCHAAGSGYSCHCDHGYTGTNCDIASHACSSNPCYHGSCHILGTTYVCHCSYGYKGTNCDHGPVNRCPTGFISLVMASGGNICIEISNHATPLSTAWNVCHRNHNGHLVTLDTEEKRNALWAMLTHKAGIHHGEYLWTGLSWNPHDRWAWHGHASVLNSDSFIQNFSHLNASYTCAGVTIKKNGDWSVHPCADSFRFICETP